MRTVLIQLSTLILACIFLAIPIFVRAQAGPSRLVAWAALPAGTLADGPSAGQKLGTKAVNGLKVPFASQPVGSITAIVPGSYANSWLVLSNSVFDNPQNSGDYFLRIYTVEVAWRDTNGGDGNVTVVDWTNLTDPGKKVTKALHNANAANRPLSGGDFAPRAFVQLGNGSIWVAEATGPSLLHFDGNGRLAEAPIALSGGALQGMSKLPDNKTLVIALRSNSSVAVHTFDTGAHAFGNGTATFPLANGSNIVGGLTMINDHQALVIEQDNKQGNAAQFKRVFVVDFQSASKTQVADLLNISDPGNISGQGAVFKFPFADIGAVYPVDGQTLVIVNDNNLPFGNARNPAQADDTEYIAVQIGQQLNLDGAFSVPR